MKGRIDEIIEEMAGGYGGTLVLAESPDPVMDTPEFLSAYLREFGDPAGDWSSYDYHFERILQRLAEAPSSMSDPRLDWDVWRAWLLFEDYAHPTGHYRHRDGSMNLLDGAPTLCWNYLSQQAPAILADAERRGWWMDRLTRDLEAPGGRPYRRWFLLHLLAKADPTRTSLEAVPVTEAFLPFPDGRRIPLRRPHPLDPFLIVEEGAEVPAFESALRLMAKEQGLRLEVFDLPPGEQAATRVHSIPLAIFKWPLEETMVINQESWSAFQPGKPFDGREWGRPRALRAIGQRRGGATIALPTPRNDGVFFFVFDRCLFVWPKARMDAAVIHLLDRAGVLSEALSQGLRERDIVPPRSTLAMRD